MRARRSRCSCCRELPARVFVFVFAPMYTPPPCCACSCRGTAPHAAAARRCRGRVPHAPAPSLLLLRCAAPRASCRCPCRAAATATCAACSARSATAAPMSPGSPPVTPPVLAQLPAGGCRLRLRLPPRCAPRDTAAARFLTAQAARRARPCPPAAADAAARLRRLCGCCSTAPFRHRRGAHVRARRTGGLLVPRLRLCPTRAPAGTGTSPLGGRAVCVEYGVALPRPPRVCGPARRRGGGYRRCHRSCRRLCCPLSTDCWSCCSSPSPPACK